MNLGRIFGGRDVYDPLRLYEDDSESSDSGSQQREEEARKDALRRRLNIYFGIAPTSSNVQILPFGEQTPSDGETQEQFEARRAAFQAAEDAKLEPFRQEQRDAAAAEASFSTEGNRIMDALRAHYADELGRAYEKGERGARFSLARRGQLGGSVDVDTQAELKSDRDMGATRIDEAVRRAMTNLRGEREQQRQSAMSLIDAGAGDEAISAAQSGIRNAIDSARDAGREQLFTDLFSAGADSYARNNDSARMAALGNYYRGRLQTYFPSSGGSGGAGRITPSE